jgi:hypothetical protein
MLVSITWDFLIPGFKNKDSRPDLKGRATRQNRFSTYICGIIEKNIISSYARS